MAANLLVEGNQDALQKTGVRKNMSEMIWEEHAFVTPVMSTVSERMDPRQGKETILLVEDEEFIRGAVREALEAAGYRVVTAESADEARAVHSRFSEAVDLLLTDVVIPGRSGHELAADLLEGFPKLRVLLMSGYADRLCLAPNPGQSWPNAMACIAKPFSAETLLGKVRAILDVGLTACGGTA
jgi:DNA-binding NtrC family response regulator